MPTTFITYEVSDKKHVTIATTIGEGQPGGVTAVLGDEVVATGVDGFPAQDIGAGQELRGRKLVIAADVTLLNEASPRASLTADLSGGMADKSQTSSQNGASGDLVTFVDVVTFV
jgi:hypothetical protein